MLTTPPERASDDGFALAEALIAILIAGIVAAGVASTLGKSGKEGATARATNTSTSIARAELEKTRVRGYTQISHQSGSLVSDPAVVGNTFDPDGNGPLTAEPIVYGATGLSSHLTARTYESITYTTRVYVTTAGSGLKRITTTVSWTQSDQPRTTSLSSIVTTLAQPIAASADVLKGTSSAPVGASAAATATRGGGQETQTAATSQPVSGWSVSGANATAVVTPGSNHRADSSAESATMSLSDLTISASWVNVFAEAVAGGSVTTGATGTVVINGVTYTNPAPGTTVTIGSWIIYLARTTTDVDGARSVTFVNVQGTAGEDYRLGWAWVTPVSAW